MEFPGTTAIWAQMARPEHEPLLEEVSKGDPSRPADLERWRSRWSRELVDVAIELCRAREKAAAKFPEAERLFADREGVEQASSFRVAEHKARRFAAIGCDPIFDLCCGIGGDAMAFTRVAPVVAVDRDARRAWMARENAGCVAVVADVEDIAAGRALDIRKRGWHLDPSRRTSGRRLWQYEDYLPGPRTIEQLLERSGSGAIKLGPGIDFSTLPELERGEIEVIGDGRSLQQAVLWTGALAREPGQRTATRLVDGREAESVSARPAPPDARAESGFLRYLFQADPAVERAGLLGPIAHAGGMEEVAPGLGLLTSNEPHASPWLTRHDIEAVLPWREKKVEAWIRAHDVCIQQVRSRGLSFDASAWQARLPRDGQHPRTLFVLRLGPKRVAVITSEPGEDGPSGSEKPAPGDR